MRINLQDGDIEFRPTIEADIEKIIQVENDESNRRLIRQWTHQEHLAAIESSNIAHFAIQKISTKELVGHVILIGANNTDRCLEFRRIAIDQKGNGYGRSAVRLIKKYTFEQIKFHRLWLEVLEHNTPAIRLYESEGFVREGFHREAKRDGEHYLSFIVMSMLEQEYFGNS